MSVAPTGVGFGGFNVPLSSCSVRNSGFGFSSIPTVRSLGSFRRAPWRGSRQTRKACFGSGEAQPGESKPSGLVHGQKRSSALEDRATLLPRRAMRRSRRLVHHWAEIAVYLTSAVSEFTRPRIVSALRRSGRSRLRQTRPSFGWGSVASAVVLFQAAVSMPKYHVVILADLRQAKYHARDSSPRDARTR